VKNSDLEGSFDYPPFINLKYNNLTINQNKLKGDTIMCPITKQFEEKLEELTELRNQAEQVEDYDACLKLWNDIWDVRFYLDIHKRLDRSIAEMNALNNTFRN